MGQKSDRTMSSLRSRSSCCALAMHNTRSSGCGLHLVATPRRAAAQPQRASGGQTLAIAGVAGQWLLPACAWLTSGSGDKKRLSRDCGAVRDAEWGLQRHRRYETQSGAGGGGARCRLRPAYSSPPLCCTYMF
jgi:hypothetical protein